MNGAIVHNIDDTFLVKQIGRRWFVFRRCECIMGPHWHDQPGSYSTKASALRATTL